jgi:hypothetical protein
MTAGCTRITVGKGFSKPSANVKKQQGSLHWQVPCDELVIIIHTYRRCLVL